MGNTKNTKRIFLLGLGISTFLSVLLVPKSINANSTVPPQQRTGSPGDGQTCITCHSGSPLVNLTEGITSDIPEEGYTPGETYEITVGPAITRVQKTRYGFQFSPQNQLGDIMGSLASGTGTSLIGGGNWIGHNGAVTSNTPSWSFNWTAPEASSGDVGFYLAVVAANGNFSTSGDEVLNLDLTIKENITVSTPSVVVNNLKVGTFSDRLVVGGTDLTQLILIDLNGKIVNQKSVNNTTSMELISSNISSGVYVLKVKSANTWISRKVVIK